MSQFNTGDSHSRKVGQRMWYEIKDIHLCWAINPMASIDGCLHPLLFLVTCDRRCPFELWSVRVKWKWDLKLCGGKKHCNNFQQKIFFIVFPSTKFHCVPSLPVQYSLFLMVSGHWMRVSLPNIFQYSSFSSVQSSPSLPLSLFLPMWLSLLLWHCFIIHPSRISIPSLIFRHRASCL